MYINMMADWVRKSSTVTSREPVFLKEEVIEHILSFVPEVDGPSMNASRIARDQIIAENRKQLRRIKLVPSERAIKMIIYKMIRRFEITRGEHGSPVGINIAVALASVATQMTLDAHKVAGTGKGAGSLSSLTSLFYATQNRSDPSMVIHFSTPVSKSDVVDMRALFVETFVSDFVVSSMIGILDVVDAATESQEVTEERRLMLEEGEHLFEVFWWHKAYTYFTRKPLPESSNILRLELDAVKMYASSVTPKMIADSLKDLYVVPVYAPLGSYNNNMRVYMDLIPISSEVLEYFNNESRGYTRPYLSKIYLGTVAEPYFTKIVVKGIEGIKELNPVEVSMVGVLGKAVNLGGGEWLIKPDPMLVVRDGLPTKRIERMIMSAGIELLESALDPDEDFKMHTFRVSSTVNPIDILRKYEQDNGPDVTYVYATTVGSNLDEVLQIPWVNTANTMSNNIHELTKWFGAEMSRNFFMFDLSNVLFETGISNINSRNLTASVDFIYQRGFPLGANHRGSSKKDVGFVSLAASERAASVLATVAAFGGKQDMDLTTSIITGELASISSEILISPTPEALARRKHLYDMRRKISRGEDIDPLPIERVSSTMYNSVFPEGPSVVGIPNRRQFGREIRPSLGKVPITTSGNQSLVIGTGPKVVSPATIRVLSSRGSVVPMEPGNVNTEITKIRITERPSTVSNSITLGELPQVNIDAVLSIKKSKIATPDFVRLAMTQYGSLVDNPMQGLTTRLPSKPPAIPAVLPARVTTRTNPLARKPVLPPTVMVDIIPEITIGDITLPELKSSIANNPNVIPLYSMFDLADVRLKLAMLSVR